MVAEPFAVGGAMVMAMMIFVLNGISKVFNTLFDRLLIFSFNQVEADIALQKVNFHIVHAGRPEVLLYGKCAVGAGHSFNLPVHFFRRICHILFQLQIYPRQASRDEIIYLPRCKFAVAVYFCRVEIQFTIDTIADAARTFWQHAGDRKTFAFHGPLGAGKTTFIKHLCQAKGVTSPVSSPTFSIINQYDLGGGGLYHIDLYRLKDEDEAIRAGVEDCLWSGNICLVEWPERAAGLFPDNTVSVYFTVVDPETRIISIVY